MGSRENVARSDLPDTCPWGGPSEGDDKDRTFLTRNENRKVVNRATLKPNVPEAPKPKPMPIRRVEGPKAEDAKPKTKTEDVSIFRSEKPEPRRSRSPRAKPSASAKEAVYVKEEPPAQQEDPDEADFENPEDDMAEVSSESDASITGV